MAQREDGSLWVVDGLQRLTALQKMGTKTVRVEVFRSRGPEHEAEVFTKINNNRVGLTASDLFFAALTAQDPDAWLIKETGEKLGFVLRRGGGSSRHTDPEHAAKCLTCYGTLMQLVQRTGSPEGYEERGSLLRAVLGVLKECWPTDPLRVKSHIVDGIGIWLVRHKGLADTERLIARLNATEPRKILYTAGQGIGNASNNVADTIERLYKKRTKKP